MSSFIYILTDPSGLVKVGITDRLNERLNVKMLALILLPSTTVKSSWHHKGRLAEMWDGVFSEDVMDTKKILIGLGTVVVFVVVFAIANTGGRFASREVINLYDEVTKDDKLAEAQFEAAAELRKQLPMRVDEVTVWNTVISSGVNILYGYRVEVNFSDIDQDNFKNLLQQSLKNHACSNKSMRYILSNGGGYIYNYTSKDNFSIARIEIQESSC